MSHKRGNLCATAAKGQNITNTNNDGKNKKNEIWLKR